MRSRERTIEAQIGSCARSGQYRRFVLTTVLLSRYKRALRVTAWSISVACLSGLGLLSVLRLVGVPLAAAVPVALVTALLLGLDLWRDARRHPPSHLRAIDNAGNHAICGWCWREVVPSITLSPPQVPLNERVAEKCCRCGHVSFDGIYLSSESSYPFCDH